MQVPCLVLCTLSVEEIFYTPQPITIKNLEKAHYLLICFDKTETADTVSCHV